MDRCAYVVELKRFQGEWNFFGECAPDVVFMWDSAPRLLVTPTPMLYSWKEIRSQKL
jgi:hypothetical protein